MRVGLCTDSAPSNSTPTEGGRGEQRRGSILLKLFLIFFFFCYINMLKGAFYVVSTSDECICHCKFDLNVKKAVFLSPFEVGLHLNLSEI